MSRPIKLRRICEKPLYDAFGPLCQEKQTRECIIMSVDEYESIRLIDLEHVSQEECAARMNVARTTAQAIYNSARNKLAQCLVYGLELHIEGGNYQVCDGNGGCPECGHHENR